MITGITTGGGELARVFLKNGEQRMGILLNDTENPDSFDNGVHLLAHDQVGAYLSNPDQQLVDVYPSEQVDAIDIYMK
ncbi:MAG: hypothetical protein FD123_2991 [Bacteroidetes bacterium]|nr:MAG: hypothetical protein FD123_2991 [Bacteroidota bacterium]